MKKLLSTLLAGAIMFQFAGAAFIDLPEDDGFYPAAATLVEEKVLDVSWGNCFGVYHRMTLYDTIAALQKAFKDPSAVPEDIQKINLKSTAYDWISGSRSTKMDVRINMSSACSLLLDAKGLPLLRPSLYGKDVVDASIFSAFMYGYIDEICDRQTPLTKERLAEMIYRAKYTNPDPYIPQPTCRSGVLISTEGFSEQEAQGKIQDVEIAIKKLPEALVQDFIDKDYHLIIAPKSTFDEIYEEEWGKNENTIACYSIDLHLLLTADTGLFTIAHEMGHHLYRWYGLEKDFSSIYDKEISVICEFADRDYGRTQVKEGFADAFASYVIFGETFQKKAPMTYAYIEQLLEEVEYFQSGTADASGEAIPEGK